MLFRSDLLPQRLAAGTSRGEKDVPFPRFALERRMTAAALSSSCTCEKYVVIVVPAPGALFIMMKLPL